MLKPNKYGELQEIISFSRLYNFVVLSIYGLVDSVEEVTNQTIWGEIFEGTNFLDFPRHYSKLHEGANLQETVCYTIFNHSNNDSFTKYLVLRKFEDHYETL